MKMNGTSRSKAACEQCGSDRDCAGREGRLLFVCHGLARSKLAARQVE
jgi:hypothetical protein